MRHLLGAIFAAGLISNAQAQTQLPTCGNRLEIVKAITGAKYSEQIMIEFTGPNGNRLDLYHNPGTGTWTVIGYTLPGGAVACILATGIGMNTNPHHEMPGVPM